MATSVFDKELTAEEAALAEDRRRFELRTQKGRTQVDYIHDPETGAMVLSDGDQLIARHGFMPMAIRIKDGILHQDELLSWPGKVYLYETPLKGWSIARIRHTVMGHPKVGILYVHNAPDPSGRPTRRVYFRAVDSIGQARQRAVWLAELATSDEALRVKWLREWTLPHFEDIPVSEITLGVSREMDTE